jgi:hypothetical protein
MGVQEPPELLGIHTNMPGIFPGAIDQAAFSGAPVPSGLSADEKVAYERLQFVYQKGIAYGFQMGLRPQALYGISDSRSAWRRRYIKSFVQARGRQRRVLRDRALPIGRFYSRQSSSANCLGTHD